jgi:hypothetical protein
MTSQGPPEEEYIENRRGLLVLLVNAIDALGFNSHLLVEPLLSSAHLSQKSHLLLELPSPDHFLGLNVRRTFVCGDRLLVVALRLDIVRALDIVRMPHVGLVAVNKVRHCCGSKDTILGARIERGNQQQQQHNFSWAICAGSASTFVLPSADYIPSRR